MAIRLPSAALLATLLATAPCMANDLPAEDPVVFGARQGIPATLTLNYSADGRDARLTPVRNNYRPKVVFGGGEVHCMMRMTPGTSIEPGESGPVRLDCAEAVAVARGGGRLIVREGGKDVGFVEVRLEPLPQTSVESRALAPERL